MPKAFRIIPLLVLLFSFPHVARANAFDWDPVSDAEKQMKDNPLDPGSGALVLFKRGEINVQQATASLWSTRITTYTRIKILSDSGRDFGNVVLDTPKFLRLSKIEGRTILPSGEIIPLDTSKVFHGVAFTDGKEFRGTDDQFCVLLGAAGPSSNIRSTRRRTGSIRRHGFSIRAGWRHWILRCEPWSATIWKWPNCRWAFRRQN